MGWEDCTLADGRRGRRFRDDNRNIIVYQRSDDTYTDGSNRPITRDEAQRLISTPRSQPPRVNTAAPTTKPSYAPYTQVKDPRKESRTNPVPATDSRTEPRTSSATNRRPDSAIFPRTDPRINPTPNQRTGPRRDLQPSHAIGTRAGGPGRGTAAALSAETDEIPRIGTLITTRGGGEVETLDKSYCQRPSGFFAFGRVIAMLWHENHGSHGTILSAEEELSPGPFGQRVHSTIRRMVVVREGHGHCWCIPILTYSGRGCLKAGLSRAEIKRHAVIFMEDRNNYDSSGPQAPVAEIDAGLTKSSIGVRAAKADLKLKPMSRLNFGKVYTIEHNIKVKNIGDIVGRFLSMLEAYARNAFDEPLR